MSENITEHYAGLFKHTVFTYKNRSLCVSGKWSKTSLVNKHYNNTTKENETKINNLIKTLNESNLAHKIETVHIKNNIIPVIDYLSDREYNQNILNTVWICGQTMFKLDENSLLKFFTHILNKFPLNNVAIFSDIFDDKIYILSLNSTSYIYNNTTETIEKTYEMNEINKIYETVVNIVKHNDDHNIMLEESNKVMRIIGFNII